MSSRLQLLFVFLVVLTIFTRFLKLDWGSGYYFHPDENNMVYSILNMNKSNLDPKFYAYGQFPLYLTFFTTPKHDFKTIAMTLRFWSALFSSFSCLVFYFIGLKIFYQKKYALIFVLLLIFTPGLIQLSHFGTTESILLFIFATNIFLSFKIFDTQKIRYLFLSSIISGIGLATKISALILITPIFFSLLFLFIKKIKSKKILLYSILFILFTIIVGIILSPFNLIKHSEFISAIKYETGVATGKIQVFYTRQFIDSTPYLFQFRKIFPYVNGLPTFIFGLIGFYFIFKSFIKNHKSNIYLLILLFSSLIFYIYQGQLFAKWTRFMSPIFFVLPLISVFFIKKIKSKILFYLVIFISILPGIYFMKIYFGLDIRVQASEWISNNIPFKSKILSEGGNVVDIPLGGHYEVINFDFYSLDEKIDNLNKLNQSINQSDYIIIPSRRIYKNQNNASFPYSKNYYQNLFSGKLGFNILKTFSINNSLLLDSENAEETWSVFDNPTIRIFLRDK